MIDIWAPDNEPQQLAPLAAPSASAASSVWAPVETQSVPPRDAKAKKQLQADAAGRGSMYGVDTSGMLKAKFGGDR